MFDLPELPCRYLDIVGVVANLAAGEVVLVREDDIEVADHFLGLRVCLVRSDAHAVADLNGLFQFVKSLPGPGQDHPVFAQGQRRAVLEMFVRLKDYRVHTENAELLTQTLAK